MEINKVVSRYDEAARPCRGAFEVFGGSEGQLTKGFYDVPATNCEASAQLLLKSSILFLL